MLPRYQYVVDTTNRNFNMYMFDRDPFARSINLERHCFGEFSMANVQANVTMQDQSHVEVAERNTLFLGVYDGHGGGAYASTYVLNNLFRNLLRFAHANDNKAITEANLRDAIANTESGFLKYAETNIHRFPRLGVVGTCCLAGVIWKDTLSVANLGDSRAVLGSVVDGCLHTMQLTTDHNCSDQDIRTEIRKKYPEDQRIVRKKDGVYCVKGFLEVTRSIGDAYLKSPDYLLMYKIPINEPVPPPFTRGVVSAEPEMVTRAIADTDKFLIFASDGFWELMTNEEATEMVHCSPRHEIAKRLLSTALTEAARRRGHTYGHMQTMPPGRENLGRRTFHDDISVIVVFFDKKTIFRKPVPNMSYKGSNVKNQPSEFAGSALTLHSFTVKGMKNLLKKRFMRTSSTVEGQRLLDGAESSQTRIDRDEVVENERDLSSRPKSRWDKLKKKLKLKKD